MRDLPAERERAASVGGDRRRGAAGEVRRRRLGVDRGDFSAAHFRE